MHPRTPLRRLGNSNEVGLATPTLNIYSAKTNTEKDTEQIDSFLEDMFKKITRTWLHNAH